jgi:hypothetical protein
MLALVGVLLLMSTGTAFAFTVDESPGENLGGYDSLSSAMAFSFRPFLPALISTGDVPFEGTVAVANSRVKSGGISLGHGALVYPGSGAANLGPILGVAFGQPEIGALIPSWPFEVSATQSTGEVSAGPAPALSFSATGYPDRGGGDVRIGEVHVPGLVHIEHIASTTTSVVTDGSVTSTARVVLQGVSLLGGHVKAESIRSTSLTSSIGSAASSSGDVDIIGLTIGGINVSVTDDGFQVDGLPASAEQAPGAGGEPFPGQSPEDAVNAVLESLGARITLFKSITNVRGGRAERMQPGVVISLDNPVGGTGPIPAGRFDIFLGATSASALATLPFSAGVPDVVPGVTTADDSTGGGSPSISIGGGPEVGGETLTGVGEELTGAAGGALGAAQGGLGDAVPRRSDYHFGGLPIGMVIGLLLVAFLLARYIRNFFKGLMPGGSGVSPDEGEIGR